MSNNKHEALTAYPPAAPQYNTAPPPMGYPTRDGPAGYGYPQQQSVPQAQAQQTISSKGDDFWKGCCAALCCCCVLDCCL